MNEETLKISVQTGYYISYCRWNFTGLLEDVILSFIFGDYLLGKGYWRDSNNSMIVVKME